jgi:copper resistance protein C
MVLSAPPAAAQATPGDAAPGYASRAQAVPAYAFLARATLAHAKLKSIAPKHKSVQTATPAEVVLTFNERPKREYTEVRVTGPGGDAAGGEIAVTGERVRLPLKSLTEAGRYRVAYRTVSVDGHVISGEREFTFRPAERPAGTPASGVPSPGATPGAGGAVGGSARADEAAGGSDSSPLVWLLLGGVAAALVTGGVVAFVRGRGDR